MVTERRKNASERRVLPLLPRPRIGLLAAMTLPPPDVAAEMPVAQLGLIVLKDMLESSTWNERNYVLEAQ